MIKWIAEEYPEALKMDGFDDCIIGICHRISQESIIAYDQAKVIKKLMKRDRMTYQEAIEFFNYNQLGSYVGEHTPCFIEKSV